MKPFLTLGRNFTAKEYAQNANIAISTARRDLNDLTQKGMLKKEGKTKNVRYTVMTNIFPI